MRRKKRSIVKKAFWLMVGIMAALGRGLKWVFISLGKSLKWVFTKSVALISLLIPRKALGEVAFWWSSVDPTKKFLVAFFIIFIGSGYMIGEKITNDHNRIKDTRCLAMNVYHEARGEPLPGKYAVAEVTMNRVKSKRYPNDVCDVVYQRAWVKRYNRYVSEFSWTTDKQTDIPKESEAWLNSVKVAQKVYYSKVEKSYTHDALYYHADYVKPWWSKKLKKTAKIGKHIFYK